MTKIWEIWLVILIISIIVFLIINQIPINKWTNIGGVVIIFIIIYSSIKFIIEIRRK